MNPDIGFGIGSYPLYTTDSSGNMIVNENNAKFWVDKDGNVHLKGKLDGCDGVFSGELKAATGSFSGEIKGGSINIGNGNFVVDANGNLTARTGFFNGTLQGVTYLTAGGTNMMNSNNQFKSDYLNLKGITVTDASGATTFKVDSSGNVTLSGNITMGAGSSINWATVSEVNASSSKAYQLANSANTTANTAKAMADEALGYADTAYWTAYNNKVTEENVFNVLTNGGTRFGVFSNSTGQLYINASYIKTGILDAGSVWLANNYGSFQVAYGYDGRNTTYGAMVTGGSSSNYFIATNGGVRMTAGSTFVYCDGSNVVSSDGIHSASDARLKNSISYDIDKYDQFFMLLKPCYFKFNNKNDKFETGFIAQEVKQALLDSGLTEKDFAGFSIAYSDEEDVKDRHILSYTSFVALNTHMIQKLVWQVNELKDEISKLKEKN